MYQILLPIGVNNIITAKKHPLMRDSNKRALKNTPSFKAPPGIFNNGGRGGKEVPPLASSMPTIWHDSCKARIIPGFQYFLARYLHVVSWHGSCSITFRLQGAMGLDMPRH